MVHLRASINANHGRNAGRAERHAFDSQVVRHGAFGDNGRKWNPQWRAHEPKFSARYRSRVLHTLASYIHSKPPQKTGYLLPISRRLRICRRCPQRALHRLAQGQRTQRGGARPSRVCKVVTRNGPGALRRASMRARTRTQPVLHGHHQEAHARARPASKNPKSEEHRCANATPGSCMCR
jgi:hypothetical protein